MCAKHKKDEEAIFNEAIKINSSAERTAFIKSACGDDAALLARIEGLLKVHFEDESFLKSPPGADVTLDTGPLSEGPGTKIGHYKLLQLIGEGGFGVVYMAEQEEPIRRKVAFKIIKLGMDTKEVIARFEAERQALAMMDHSNIAKVFDAGATDTGRPYFVMELVKGIPITEYCDKNNLDTHQRLELFIDVCKAVQHAHQKGIIHRDIKPSNVLITLHDGKPVPKIIDFGIAKATQHRLTEKTLFTEFRQFIGTPEYMSPEQAEMSGLDVDTRSDIYSLGVLLYELLTGTTPFEAEKLRSAAYDEVRRIIREDEPPKPSTRLKTLGDTLADIAKHRHVQPGELCRTVRGDLDWIVLKTLEKDRTRRYETANELAADIQRHLSDEPVVAGPPSAVYRIKKFVRRNKTLVTGVAIVLVVLLAGIVVSTIFAIGESRARKLADNARDIAEEARKKETAARIEAVTARNEAQQAGKFAEEQRNQAQQAEKLAQEQRLQMQRLLVKAKFERGIKLLNEGDELGMLDLLEAWENTEDNSGLRESIGRLWAIAHDLSAERLVHIIPGGPVRSVSPDGKFLVTTGENTAQLREMETWQTHGPPLQLERTISAVKFSPDGRMLAAHSAEGESRLWYTSTREPVGSILQHNVDMQRIKNPNLPLKEASRLIAFSPDGKLLATGYLDGTVRFWDTSSGQSYGKGIQYDRLRAIAFSPDSKLIATGSLSPHVGAQLWEVDTSQPYGPPMKTDGAVEYVLFSPDGKLLATKEGTTYYIYLWDTETGRLYRTLQHDRWMDDMELSPDGKLLAAGSRDWTAPIWDVATGKLIGKTSPHRRPVDDVAFSLDGKLLATNSGGDKTLRLWDVAAGNSYGPQLYSPWSSRKLIFSPDDKFLIGPGNRIWKTRQQLRTEIMPYQAGSEGSDISPDGNIGAIIIGNTVQLWDIATKQLVDEPLEHDDKVTKVAFSPDGKLLACSYGGFYPTIPGTLSGSYGKGYIRIWQVPAGRPFGPILETGYAFSLTFSPDGKLLADGTIGSTADVFDMTTWQRVQTFDCGGYVYAVAFSPDCKVLAAGLNEGMVELWDITTGEQISSPLIHSSQVLSVAFSPDGNLLATVSGNEEQTVRIWDIGSDPPYQSLALPPLAMRGKEVLESFSKNGSILVSRYGDDTAQAWRLPVAPADLREMQLKTWTALGAQRNQEGEVISIQPDQWQRLRRMLRRELAIKMQASKLQLVDVSDSTRSEEFKLIWTPGRGAVAYNVYFGTDPNKLELLGKVKEASYENVPELDRDKIYWWRIDTVKSDGSVTKGNLWKSRIGKMVGWWKFDETGGNIAYDSSSNDNHGMLERALPPTPPLWKPAGGWFNGALQFDGVDDYINCGNDDRLNITDEITLAAWVNTNDAGNSEHNPYASKGDHSYAIKHHNSNNIEFVIYDSDWHFVQHPVDSSFNGAWHHLAGTYDGSELKLYVDGELEANSPYAGSIDSSTFNVNIGRNSEITNRFYNGLLDDVTIFSRALDGAEIIQLKNSGGASFIGDPSLEALWELDESGSYTAYDSGGNGIDGSLEPSSPLWRPAGGQLGGALEFDGSNDYVSIPNESNFDVTDQVTVSAWIKVKAFSRDWQAIVTKGDTAWRLHRLQDTNSIAFHCNLYSDFWGAEGSINVNDDKWHHIVGVYDGKLAYLYVDGVLDYSQAAVGLISTNDSPVMIGENAEQQGRYWNGLIDDVAIFSRALDGAEITQLKNSGGASFIGDPNLEALWELDESSGDTAYDSSGNDIDGSLEPNWQPAGGVYDVEIINGPQWTNGRIGGALQFDGEDDFVSLPIGPLISTLNSATIMIWINFSNEGGAWQRIFDFGTGTNVNMFLTPNNEYTNAMRFAITTSGLADEDQANALSTLASGWHHVAVTIDADVQTSSLYLDGSVVDENPATSLTPSDLGVTTNNWLGRSQYPADAFFKGSMDDVRIYNYALSQAEVAAIYAGEEPRPHEKTRWVVDISKEGYIPPEPEPEEGDEYYVPLESEQNIKEQELLYQLEDLSIMCNVLTDLERLDPNNISIPVFCYRCALAHLGIDDTGGYRERCTDFLEHFEATDDPNICHWVAWTCALASDSVEDFNNVIKLSELAVEKVGESDRNRGALGAILYRAGRFDEAVEHLSELATEWEQGKGLPTLTSPAYTWYFLAMAHHQLGNTNESQRYLKLANERAEEEMAGDALWNRRLTLQLLQAEAQSLLGVSENNSTNEEDTVNGKND